MSFYRFAFNFRERGICPACLVDKFGELSIRVDDGRRLTHVRAHALYSQLIKFARAARSRLNRPREATRSGFINDGHGADSERCFSHLAFARFDKYRERIQQLRALNPPRLPRAFAVIIGKTSMRYT